MLFGATLHGVVGDEVLRRIGLLELPPNPSACARLSVQPAREAARACDRGKSPDRARIRGRPRLLDRRIELEHPHEIMERIIERTGVPMVYVAVTPISPST
jgi:hypothetical protein